MRIQAGTLFAKCRPFVVYYLGSPACIISVSHQIELTILKKPHEFGYSVCARKTVHNPQSVE